MALHLATDIMVFLPYTPRVDADARGYEGWLRDIDNPFFNRVSGILHYSNWKVTSGDPGFTHFDFMYLDPARADAVWTNSALLAFAAGWVRSWGVAPNADDPAVNYHAYRLARVSGDSVFDARPVALATSATPGSVLGGAVWRVSADIVGASPLPFHEFRFGAPVGENVTGQLIAAPND